MLRAAGVAEIEAVEVERDQVAERRRLDAVERAGFDVLGGLRRPRPSRFAWRLARSVVASLRGARP